MVLVYLAGVTGLWWPTPDSALYQGLAKSLLSGQGYRFNGQLHNTATPGFPLILAALMAVCNPAIYYWAANLLVVFCGLGALLFSYLAVARIADRRMALAVTLAVGLSYKTYEVTHLILTDAPFALVFWCLVYASLRYLSKGRGLWLLTAGALTVLGLTIRVPGAIALGAAAVGLALDRSLSALHRRRLAAAVILGVTAAVLGGFYLVGKSISPQAPGYAIAVHEGLRSTTVLVHRLKTALLPWVPLATVLGGLTTSQEFAPAGVAFGVLTLVGVISMAWRGRRFTPVVVVLVCLGLVLVAQIRGRYLLTIYPLVVLLMFEGLCRCIQAVVRWTRWSSRAYLYGVSILVILIIAVNALRLGRNAFYYGYLGRSHPHKYYATISKGDFVELFDIADRITNPPGPIAASKDETYELHYLTGRILIPIPHSLRPPLSEADALYEQFMATHANLYVVTAIEQPFYNHLKERFASTPDLKPLYLGQQHLVYQRVEPASQQATRAASRASSAP